MIREIKKVEVGYFREVTQHGQQGPKQHHGKITLILSDGIEQVVCTQPWMNKTKAEEDTKRLEKMFETLIVAEVSD